MDSSYSTDYQNLSHPTAPPPPPVTGIPITNMPVSRAPPIPTAFQTVPWSSGLFDCFSDTKNCCITCWCPCITAGQISEIVDKGETSKAMGGALYTLFSCILGCPCCFSTDRKKIRQQYGLQESPCGDCVVHCFCDQCALCQEYRELQYRGFDVSLGWLGNVEKQNPGVVAMAPVVERGMAR